MKQSEPEKVRTWSSQNLKQERKIHNGGVGSKIVTEQEVVENRKQKIVTEQKKAELGADKQKMKY